MKHYFFLYPKEPYIRTLSLRNGITTTVTREHEMRKNLIETEKKSDTVINIQLRGVDSCTETARSWNSNAGQE